MRPLSFTPDLVGISDNCTWMARIYRALAPGATTQKLA
jgi:hypothetical protein